MITLKKIQGSQLRGLLSPLLRIGSHGAAVWRPDFFTVEASTESVTVQLRLESGCFDHYACSETTGTWLNLHHLDRIFSSTAGDESLIMSAITSANHMATNMYFVYEHHGTFTAETNLRGCIIPHHHRNVNVSVLSYQVLVGISSWDFRRIIWHFAEQGTQFVQAHITNGQVRFLSGFFEDIVLTAESGGCIILNGPGHSGELIIRINMLENVYSYISAAEHSTHMVWLHHSGVNAPDKIIILVTEFIYFLFYMNG